MDLHRKISSKDSREMLTSTAWNALIHHPVVDESDAEELPSTVDMDAIKEAPSTPLTAPSSTWPIGEKPTNNKRDVSEDSSSDDDEDSDGTTRSSSGSDSDESGSDSCSWSSSASSSRSSSCSTPHRSVPSSPSRQTFSVSKPDFDQSGLKLKISALKVSSTGKPSNLSQTGTDSDSCSSQSVDPSNLAPAKKLPVGNERTRRTARIASKVTFSDEADIKKVEPKARIAPPELKVKDKPKNLRSASALKNAKGIDSKTGVDAKPFTSTKKVSETVKSTTKSVNFPDIGNKPAKLVDTPMPVATVAKTAPVFKKVDVASKRENDPSKTVLTTPVKSVTASPTKASGTTPAKNQSTASQKLSSASPQSKKKASETSKLRSVRKKPTAAATPTQTSQGMQKTMASNGGGRYGRTLHTSRSLSSTSDSSESEEDNSRDDVAHITELAQQLGHIGTSENLPSMSEHLQVINQEDLAAILPDVVTTETHTGFDGFEDVSSESGKAEKKDGGAQDSGSEVELPDQIVSDAIKRIHVDSEDLEGSESEKDAVKQTPQKPVHRHPVDSGSSSSEETDVSPVYSSSLLQQFVEKTEILSAQCERLLSSGRPRKTSAGSNQSAEGKGNKRTQRAARVARVIAEVPPAGPPARAMPELEAYRLDCSHSNVSPDSGIQSVPGSPLNESTPRDSTPPVLRPVSPPDKCPKVLKKRPGRPRKIRNRRFKNSAVRKNDDEAKVEDRPPIHSLIPGRRGPGRPKKAPPVLEPSVTLTGRDESDANNLNLVLNEICERVNRRLEQPSSKGRGLEIKELERIISDHKSNKARNSKIEGIFSLENTRKLSSVPNIAIVKPMQLHVHNETRDDDEKHNKRVGRRGKIEKFEDLVKLKEEMKEVDSVEKTEKMIKERRKSDRDKKIPSKPLFPIPNRFVRARSRHLSSGTDGSLDKSADSDYKKPETTAFSKTEVKPKKGEVKKSVKTKKDLTGPSFVKAQCAVHPMPRKMAQKKRPKVLGLRHNLIHHKHKRKKNKKYKKNYKKSFDREWFLKELEKLIADFQKCSIAGKKHLLAAPVQPTTVADHFNLETKVPAQEARVKRIGKKRKGSERSRGSDRESGAEKSKLSDRESGTDEQPKEKEREKDKVEREKPKRKQKKSSVEVVKGKDKTETSSNEQRLPLKKRHYHLTSSSQIPPSSDTSQSDKQTAKESGKSDKPTGKDSASLSRKEGERNRSTESQRVLRSSVDDAIEATITRFSSVSPDLSKSSSAESGDSGQRTVIVTPKKRHKIEEPLSSGGGKSSGNAKGVASSAVAKIGSGKGSSHSKSNSSPAGEKSKGSGNGSLAREGVIKSVGNTEPKRRSGSRSSSLSNKEVKSEKVVDNAKTVEKNKKSGKPIEAKGRGRPERIVRKAAEKMLTRSATKPVEIEESSSKTEPLHIDLPVFTSDSIKIESPNNESLEMTTLIPSAEIKVEAKAAKQPVAGIFEPSLKAVEIDSSILIPLNSPSEMGNSIKGSLSMKKLKISKRPVDNVDGNLHKLDSKSVKTKIKAKYGNKMKDLRINLAKLDSSSLLMRASTELKNKARRRKMFNRTGFPSKKKKKRLLELKTAVQPSVISTSTETQTKPDKHSESIAQKRLVTEPSPEDINNVLTEGEESSNSNLPLSDIKICESQKEVQSDVDELPLKSSSKKPVEKISARIEEKLNAGRRLVKRTSNLSASPASKRPKLERLKTGKNVVEEVKKDVPDKVVETKNAEEVVETVLNPTVRKRKRINTVKSSTLKLKRRHQFPLLSMKKFKKSKEEEKSKSGDDSASEAAETPVADNKKKPQPRWRKKYLTAGLFSDYFKVDVSDKSSAKVPERSLHKCVYNPDEHEHGLLPPPAYCNKFVRSRRQDFLLPFDLWWQHVNNQLPGRDIVPSWNYRKIRTNVYYDVKPQTTGTNEVQACNCKVPGSSKHKACGEDCINRMVYVECSPQLCPCESRCSNQRIQRHAYAPGLERFMTKEKGWGVRSSLPIRAGEFILEYVGEVVSEKEFKERMASRYVNDKHHYCLHLDGGLVIDGHRMGGDGRFVNHGCEPNCEMQKWTVNGLFRMALFALRNIPAFQELTYDYNFSLFNPVEGQVCLCGAKKCRGVIGGKSQRVTVQGGTVHAVHPEKRDRKTGRGRKNGRARRRNDKDKNRMEVTAVKTNSKPMSHQQRCFAQVHHCFLLRNVEKVKQGRNNGGKPTQRCPLDSLSKTPVAEVKQSDVFYTQLNALSTLRSIKTRRLAQAEDNPEMAKVAKLAHVFKELFSAITTAKDERGENLSTPFTTLPTKRKHPQYYTRIAEPIDLNTIEQNINSGKYSTIEAFDFDIKRLFTNNVRFYGRTSELGIAATRLKRTYNLAKMDVVPQLEVILGESLPASFLPEKTDPGAEEEDVIRCICGLYKDEGVMIQCERCLVWQHCDCVKADDSWEHYLCERCEPRSVNYEILMEPQPEYAQEGQTHYISLMRGTLQLRLSDTVYVLRDMLEESVSGNSPPRKVTYKTMKNVNYADLDIFRIERLWIDDKGNKFAFGHHYLRPHETYHEPSRKFFTNEVMRVPLYEVVPLDLIMQHCWVLDLNTFCKGRPVNAPEEHIYICEYRVDKSAHLFAKIAKPYPICTKNYAFERFDTRLRPVRTYTPHGEAPMRGRARSNTRSNNGDEHRRADSDEELPLARVRDHAHAAKRDVQKKRLNKILLNLLGKLPSKQLVDVSYLLEPVKRARSKSACKKLVG